MWGDYDTWKLASPYEREGEDNSIPELLDMPQQCTHVHPSTGLGCRRTRGHAGAHVASHEDLDECLSWETP